MLIILTIIVFYLAFSQFRKNNTTEIFNSTNRVLLVEIDSDLERDDLSDYTQIQNALKDGGTMRLNPNNLDKTLDSKIDYYAATDSNGQFWVLGALLNYIASEGWELVQAPTTGLATNYYFIRK